MKKHSISLSKQASFNLFKQDAANKLPSTKTFKILK